MLERKESSVTIFRGDDTGGQLGKTIVINFHCGNTVNMEGVVVTFILGGFYEKEFHNVHDGDRLEIFMTHEQTAMLPLGVSFGKLYGTDASGKIRTFSNRIPIRVTNRVCEAYGSAEEDEIDVTISNAITWDSILGKPETFPPSEHRHQKSDIDNLESDLKTLSDGVESAIEAAEAAKTEAAKGVRTVNGKGPTDGNVKIVLDDLADKDGNIETTKTIMVSRDGGESHVAVALYSDLISEIDTHNNNESAHPKLMATVARNFATKTEVDAKADKSALQAEVDRAQAAETQLTTKAENAQTAANMAQNTADVAQNMANVASDKADAVYAELANKLDKTAVVAPSASATAGQAADAKAVNDALAMKASSNITTASDDKIRIVYGDNVWWIAPLGIYYWNDGESGEHAHSPTAVFALPTSVYSSSLALTSDIADAVKGKVGSFESVGGASATIENGVAKLSDFFTASNSLLTGTIDTRLPYPLYAVPSTGLLKDRALNTTSIASVTVPDNFTDLLIRASVVKTASLPVTMPSAITTVYGDDFPGDTGEFLVTITKTGAAEAYVRTIKLEVANV